MRHLFSHANPHCSLFQVFIHNIKKNAHHIRIFVFYILSQEFHNHPHQSLSKFHEIEDNL